MSNITLVCLSSYLGDVLDTADVAGVPLGSDEERNLGVSWSVNY